MCIRDRNYIDTAFPYHHGDSEPFVGRVLKKYDRSSYYLTTKLPLWDIKTLDDAKEMFEKQLQRLGADYVDFYLLHALDKEKWDKARKLGIVSYCEELKAQGRIRNFGFSFHDEYEVFEEILTYRKWDFCQIQYNYVDTHVQTGDRGYALAERLGIPMVIMEPIKGGSLSQLPQDLAARLKEADPQRSISSWALRWVASKPNVKVVLRLSLIHIWYQAFCGNVPVNSHHPLPQEMHAFVQSVFFLVPVLPVESFQESWSRKRFPHHPDCLCMLSEK